MKKTLGPAWFCIYFIFAIIFFITSFLQGNAATRITSILRFIALKENEILEIFLRKRFRWNNVAFKMYESDSELHAQLSPIQIHIIYHCTLDQ